MGGPPNTFTGATQPIPVGSDGSVQAGLPDANAGRDTRGVVNKYSTPRCVSPHTMRLRVRLDYTDNKLLDKLDEIEKEKEDIIDYNKYIQVWKKYLKIDENINLLLPDELLILSKFDFREPKDIPHPPYKYPRINFLVFDDLVGDAHAFKKGHSAINKLYIKHRH